jgi:hypothetical protein
MKKQLTRVGYVALFLLWLVLMCAPAFFCALMLNSGELTWGDDPTDQVRLFVMQERGKEGLGMQWTRPLADEPLCTQTTVRYWMWAGEGENVSVCSCAGEGLVCGGD